jgi:phospholipid/cholesterol/gamma-HCH transport system substrate-binding protein
VTRGRLVAVGGLFTAVLLTVVALCLVQFRGGFDRSTPLLVQSSRSGLLLDSGAKVKMLGVRIGTVSGVTVTDSGALIHLDIYPSEMHRIRADATAQVLSTTAFGSKFVEIAARPNSTAGAMKPGSVITSDHVTTEVNSIFENLTNVMRQIQPEKLNATLAALSDGLSGRGEELGRTLVTGDAYLKQLNPVMPQFEQDTELASTVINTYADAAPDIMRLLDDFSATSATIRSEQDNVRQVLLSAIGLGVEGNEVLSKSEKDLVASSKVLVPTTRLARKYSPEIACLLQSADRVREGAYNWSGGTNGYSADLDVGLLLGDDQYIYPKNLPRVAAQGGPGGEPGCYPKISPVMYPAPYLVMDNGASQGSATKIKPGQTPFVQYLFGNAYGGGTP